MNATNLPYPVIAESAVVVVGGGPAGFIAGIAAARTGADVLLVESGAYLGGNLNLPGLALLAARDWDFAPVISGLMDEFIERLIAVDGASGHFPCPKHLSVCSLDPEMVRYVSMEMCVEAGIQLLLHTQVSDALIDDENNVTALVVENKSGRSIIQGRVFVDASGDADLIARAGGRFEKGDARKGNLQPMTFTFRLGNANLSDFVQFLHNHSDALNLFDDPPRQFPVQHVQLDNFWTITGLATLAREAKIVGDFPDDLSYVNVTRLPKLGQVGVNAARVFQVDGTNALDLTRAEIEGRRKVLQLVQFFKNHVPGFESSVLLDMAPRIGVRETRRIVGQTQLTKEDIYVRRVFPDAIAQGIYPIDIHSQDATPSTFLLLQHPYTIPYSALVSPDVGNVITAGRAISTDREAFGSIRVMTHCMAIGHAAGVASALALNVNDCFAEINVGELQDILTHQNALTGIVSK